MNSRKQHEVGLHVYVGLSSRDIKDLNRILHLYNLLWLQNSSTINLVFGSQTYMEHHGAQGTDDGYTNSNLQHLAQPLYDNDESYQKTT